MARPELIIVDCEQGTPEWKKARAGRVTASRMADLLAKGKGISRQKYLGQIIAERDSGEPSEMSFKSASMEWGTQQEEDAATLYEWEYETRLTKVGFVIHPAIELSGCSPDRLCGDEGIVQIKCPDTHTHIETFMTDEIDSRYLKQMQWEMACTHSKWCDFVSFDPRVKQERRLFVKRIRRDPAAIVAMQAEVQAFLREVDETIKQLDRKSEQMRASRRAA